MRVNLIFGLVLYFSHVLNLFNHNYIAYVGQLHWSYNRCCKTTPKM